MTHRLAALARVAGRPLAVLLALLIAPGAARAQGIDTLLFKPAPGPGDLFSVQRSRLARGYAAGLYLSFADGSLKQTNARGTIEADIVDDQVVAELIGAWTPWRRLEIGLGVPVVLNQSSSGTTGTGLERAEAQSLGDLRLVPKYRIVQLGGLTLAAAVPVSFPTAGDQYAGDRTVTAAPRAIGDAQIGRVGLALNLGGRFRGDSKMEGADIGNELTYGAGLAVDVGPRAALIGEIYGAAGGDASASPMEALAGVRATLPMGLTARVAAGRGLINGYGASDLRVLAGLGYEPPKEASGPPPPPPADPDPDRDGLLGGADSCPLDAEDKDAFEDADGCPDPDNDHDGIVDASDRCVADAEDKDGFEDADGCPETDNDKDGLPDLIDRCPIEPEDKDENELVDGCPDPDNDHDGFLDAADRCPNEAEVINGVEDTDGCPDKGEVKVIVRDEKIEVREKVFFETNSDRIMPVSFPILDQIAAVLKASPRVKKIRVEGHTDDVGADDKNLDLSKRRALSVVLYLVEQGVEIDRLESEGYGETKPLVPGMTKEARATNRRVEFVIVEQQGVGAPNVPGDVKPPAPAQTPKLAPTPAPTPVPEAPK
ncbi:MAG: OmpA family protein [Myxococcota bacterium]